MTLADFKSTLTQNAPPSNIPALLKALWFDAKNDWDAAHNIAQDVHSNDGSWIHAYLHRKEGDFGNAGYWYSRANKSFPTKSLSEEWEELVQVFLNK